MDRQHAIILIIGTRQEKGTLDFGDSPHRILHASLQEKRGISLSNADAGLRAV